MITLGAVLSCRSRPLSAVLYWGKLEIFGIQEVYLERLEREDFVLYAAGGHFARVIISSTVCADLHRHESVPTSTLLHKDIMVLGNPDHL